MEERDVEGFGTEGFDESLVGAVREVEGTEGKMCGMFEMREEVEKGLLLIVKHSRFPWESRVCRKKDRGSSQRILHSW